MMTPRHNCIISGLRPEALLILHALEKAANEGQTLSSLNKTPQQTTSHGHPLKLHCGRRIDLLLACVYRLGGLQAPDVLVVKPCPE